MTELTNSFPSRGRIAAMDHGTVRIGVAICDPDRILASPLTVIAATQYKTRASDFTRLVSEERLVGFVVGLPIHADGNESPSSTRAREFAIWLRDTTKLPVRLFDERFTTVEANKRLSMGKITRVKRTRRIDAVAATVLLESFLEADRYLDSAAGLAIDDPVPTDTGSLN